MKRLFLFAFVAIAFNLSAQSVWTSDKAHSKMAFTVTHLAMSEVDGVFKDFDFKITSSKDDFSDAVFEATADLKTLTTNNGMRDGHLQKEDMFDTEKYPTMTFKSNSIKAVSAKKFKLSGELTLKGVTKPVVLDLTLLGTGENQRSKKPMAGFKVTGTIKRTDFGVGTMPSLVVSEDVELVASAEFVKQ